MHIFIMHIYTCTYKEVAKLAGWLASPEQIERVRYVDSSRKTEKHYFEKLMKAEDKVRELELQLNPVEEEEEVADPVDPPVDGPADDGPGDGVGDDVDNMIHDIFNSKCKDTEGWYVEDNSGKKHYCSDIGKSPRL